MAILRLLVGSGLLFLGRKLFWLFVAGIGFFVALGLATRFLADLPEWAMLVLGVIAGLMGALIAVFLQRAAIGVAGFLAGGYLVQSLVDLLGFDGGTTLWVAFLVGGILGAILLSAVVDWALIILSSLAGAAMIVQSVDLSALYEVGLFSVALLVGVIVQRRLLKKEKKKSSD